MLYEFQWKSMNIMLFNLFPMVL